MKKLKQKRIPKKVSEQLETSKTRKKITELSYNSEVLPFKVRFAVDEIRKEYVDRSEKMRERYDRVIKEYRDNADNQSKDFLITRTKVHNDIVAKLDRILDRDK